jgi:hypothetical protein
MSYNNNSKYNEYQYKKQLYDDFNTELSLGISQGLSLYDPVKDKTLFKDTKKLEDEYKPLIEQEEKDKHKNIFNDINSLFSPFIGGNIGEDIYNFFLYKNGDIDEYKSKTIEFYEKPATKIINNYKSELLTLMGVFLVFLIIYKKI